MRVTRFALLWVLTCSAVYAAPVPTDADLLARVKKLEGFVRFTKERTPLENRVDEGCVRFDYETDNLGGPGHERLAHRIAGIHVYVTEGGFASTKGRQTAFPVGTIVLKQKFPTLDATEPELYTGMLKRENGYNPKAGDWEFFTMNGSATAVTARGRIDSCMDCHQQYAKTDFVTKRYVSVFPVRRIFGTSK
ncbi:MAG TPA: cytochrome P460 family protein [Chthoniobacteraceae bacterium]|nr:cytochrome P460 family protein [Chthoniobacteraceae bacterium]